MKNGEMKRGSGTEGGKRRGKERWRWRQDREERKKGRDMEGTEAEKGESGVKRKGEGGIWGGER